MFDRPNPESSGLLIWGSTVKREEDEKQGNVPSHSPRPGSGTVLGGTLWEAFDYLGGIQKKQLRW